MLIGALPFLHQLALFRKPEQHERRRAGGMDRIDAVGRLAERTHLLPVRADDALEFLDRAVADVVVRHDEPDAFGQQPRQLLDRARAACRIDDADCAAPVHFVAHARPVRLHALASVAFATYGVPHIADGDKTWSA